MSTYGFQRYEKVGHSIHVSADGRPLEKAGGITLAWETITAYSSDTEIRPEAETGTSNFLSTGAAPADFVYAGEKYLRWGQVVCRIKGGTYDGKFAPYGTASGSLASGTLLTGRGDMYILNHSIKEVDYNSDHPQAIDGGLLFYYRILFNYAKSQTITINATGGTFTISYKGQTTSALAYNASAATVDAALEALSTIGVGKVATSLASSVYTLVFDDSIAPFELVTTNAASLTGGTQTATVGTTASSVYGPTVAEFEAAFPAATFVKD